MSRSRFLAPAFVLLAAWSAPTQAEETPSRPGASASNGALWVKPYLQLGYAPAKGTLRVLWHVPDADAEWSLEYRLSADSPWKKANLAEPRRVAVEGVEPHRVQSAGLTGLEPGGTFAYRVLKNGERLFSAAARAPQAAGQPYRFAVFGDCGVGSTDQKSMAYRAIHSKPDLVVIPGDIVYDRGRISEYRTRFWPAYNADEASPEAGGPLLRSTLFVAAPGNHDVATRDLDKYPDGLAYFLYWEQPLNGPPGKEGSAFVPRLIANQAHRRAFTAAAGAAYPRMTNFSFDYGNVHWTIIDSNPYVDWTNRALIDWVASDLAAAQSSTWRFVVFHHPGFNSSKTHFEDQQMRPLAPVFEVGKVDVVFSGHVHNYQRTFPLRFTPSRNGAPITSTDAKASRSRVVNGHWVLDTSFDGRSDTTPDGIIYVITGAGGQKLYNPEQQDKPDSWQAFTDKFVSKVHSLTVADVDGTSLRVRQLTGDGREVDRFTIIK